MPPRAAAEANKVSVRAPATAAASESKAPLSDAEVARALGERSEP